MPRLTRRRWLSGAALSAPLVWSSTVCGQARSSRRRVATFQVDVTPPLGHPLLGGGYRRAEKIGDPLYAHGLVFTGDEKPIVVVALDWCELRNEAHARWRAALAEALETTPQHVLVHCLHQHDAPYVDLGAERLLRAAAAPQAVCDPNFHEQTVRRVAAAAQAAAVEARPFTHLACGAAEVEGVASNRRVLKPDGTPYFGRYSTCRDAQLREQPAGEIDPRLVALTFYSADEPVAVLHAFAVHPMSPYGRGIASADFVGDARARRRRDQPKTVQVYATGCAGDVTAGKFNDGGADVRRQLADRLYDAMVRADRRAERRVVDYVTVRSQSIVLPFWDRPDLREEPLTRIVRDAKASFSARATAALGLSSILYNRQTHGGDGHHLDLQVVDFGSAQIALFPAESFVSFQLQVQAAAPNQFVVPLGFGECAPGYIPTVAAVREGFREEHGYCWVDETAERRIVDGMKSLLS